VAGDRRQAKNARCALRARTQLADRAATVSAA
jgi:hypothetical protein